MLAMPEQHFLFFMRHYAPATRLITRRGGFAAFFSAHYEYTSAQQRAIIFCGAIPAAFAVLLLLPSALICAARCASIAFATLMTTIRHAAAAPCHALRFILSLLILPPARARWRAAARA